MSAVNSIVQKAGWASWTYSKAKEAAEWGTIAIETTDPAQRNEAVMNTATKIAELAGIGIPLWFLDKALTKTGLDRIFDSLKKDQSFQDYIKNQAAWKNIRDAGLGELAEWGLDEFRTWVSKTGALDPIFDIVSDAFNKGQRPPKKDPLTLDLDNDGFETVAASSSILFDHDGDGIKTGTGWISADDGFLVLDRNGNGAIDNGTELFGDSTPYDPDSNIYNATGKLADGFAALKQEDTNVDGKVDSQDARWSQLRVWRDLNQDGISQAGELFILGQLGIASFNTTKTANNQTLANGNEIADLGTYTRADGSTGEMGDVARMGDVNLAEDTFYREFPDTIPLAEGVAALPEMRGSGMVRDLHEAASQSVALKDLLTQFSQAATRQEQHAMLDQLLDAWADTSGFTESLEERWQSVLANDDAGVLYNAFGDAIRTDYAIQDGYYESGSPRYVPTPEWMEIVAAWEQKIHILEAFNGRYFFNMGGSNEAGSGGAVVSGGGGGGINAAPTLNVSFTSEQIEFLDSAYGALKESVYSALVLQTRFKPLFDDIDLIIDDKGINLDFSRLEQYFSDQMSVNKLNGLGDLIEFHRYAGGMLQDTGWRGAEMMHEAIQGLPLTTELLSFFSEIGGSIGNQNNGSPEADIILAGYANDVMQGNAGDDLLSGGGGRDVVYGGPGNDTLIGGAGNDQLDGGAGNDTYVFGKGDGQDTITTYDPATGKTDVLQMTGLLTEEVALSRSGNSLILSVNGATDKVTITQYLQNDGNNGSKIEQIKFDDGVVWGVEDVKAKLLASTAGNDILIGYATDDTIGGGAGNDTLYGSGGNDVLNGEDGADTLFGDAGNDVLHGGEGSDILSGGTNDDTLTGGAGNDTLDGGAGSDTYVFGKGDGQDTITAYDPAVGKIDVLLMKGLLPNEVILGRSGNSLVLSVNGTTDKVTITQYLQNDGNNGSKVEQIKFEDGTVWDVKTVNGKLLTSTSGNDNLIGTSFDDFIDAGGGNDTARGNDGNDVLNGEDGTDTLFGDAGNDVLNGGQGSDILFGGTNDDTLTGGAGNDTLDGGAGSDTYVFGKGDGQDTITTYDPATGKTDVLLMRGLLTEEVTLGRSGNSLVLSVNGATDKMTITQYLQNDGNNGSKVEQIKFEDGTVWGVEDVKAKLLASTAGNDILIGYATDDTIGGGAGNDTLYGSGGNDVLNGEDGTDTLFGDAGNDVLNGGEGSDVLYGGTNDDMLTGGAGNDTLDGGAGSDTYVFGKGDGQDTITAYDPAVGKIDVLLMKGFLPSEVTLGRSGNNLILSVNGATDKMTITQYLQNDGNNGSKIEQIKFDDGTIWGVEDVKAKLLAGTAGNDFLFGYATDDTIGGEAGNDTLRGGAGNDVLKGGEGVDTLYGEAGNDMLEGGTGNDALSGGAGNDIFKFASLDDGADTISDFTSGADKIHVAGNHFGLAAGSAVQFTAGATTPVSTGTAAQFLYNSTSGALYFDQDGAENAYGAIQIVTLTGQKTLVASDIVVVGE